MRLCLAINLLSSLLLMLNATFHALSLHLPAVQFTILPFHWLPLHMRLNVSPVVLQCTSTLLAPLYFTVAPGMRTAAQPKAITKTN